MIIADTAAALTSQLKAVISSINAPNLSFTAPAINAKINEGGFLYQASFDYQLNQEWNGKLTKRAIDPVSNKPKKEIIWDAANKVPSPSSRKIWTVLDTIDYSIDYNNFVVDNYAEINGMFERTGNEVGAYHNITKDGKQHPNNTIRCVGDSKLDSTLEDGNDDDIKGLINFIRGEDYFDYDSDCVLKETRKHILGDIYHSEMIVVGAPNAETAYLGANQEACLLYTSDAADVRSV